MRTSAEAPVPAYALAAIVAVAVGAAVAAAADEPSRRDALHDTGMVERTGVALLLVDVEVTDEEGRPMPGLGPEDFELWLDGRATEIYSVDDLCACDAATPDVPADVAAAGGGRSGSDLTASAPTGAAALLEPPRFVVYLDFAALEAQSRADAVEAARSWFTGGMQPGEEAMLAAHSGPAGLQIIQEFTNDRAALVAALDAAAVDPRYFEPTTPVWARHETCKLCCKAQKCCLELECVCYSCWLLAAQDEYGHSRHSLEALRELLVRLEPIPGRKVLVSFDARTTPFPARSYPLPEEETGDHLGLVDEISAEAVLARTTVHAAPWGDGRLAVLLAEGTGGSLLGSDSFARIARGCSCTYRIAVRAPDVDRERPYRARVAVRGRVLDPRWRLRHLGPAERWQRAARAVLRDPERARDVPLVAAIVPVAARGGRWDVEVEVAIDPDALALLPSEGGASGDWEVGALLADDRARHTWEWLGVSEVRKKGEGTEVVLHESAVAALRPGRYELRAFVRDRTGDSYGGARAEIELPAVEGGTIGPVVQRDRSRVVRTALPGRDRRGRATRAATDAIELDALPLAGRALQSGEPLRFVTWVCFPVAEKDSLFTARRWIARDGAALFRFGEPSVSRAGTCASVRDELDTTALAAGDYVYHLRRDTVSGPDEREVSFSIAAPEPASP